MRREGLEKARVDDLESGVQRMGPAGERGKL